MSSYMDFFDASNMSDTCMSVAHRNMWDFGNCYQGIPETLLLNLICWLFLLLVFAILRNRAWDYGRLALVQSEKWTQLFYKTENESNESSDSILTTDAGCSWFPNIFKINKQKIFARCGPDAVHYLSFQQHLIFLMAIIMVTCIVIILPVNFQGTLQGNVTTFGHTTISNLEAHSNLLWIHVIASFLFVPLTVLIMRRCSSHISTASLVSSRTLMVTNVSHQHRSEEDIKNYLGVCYPNVEIKEIQIAYKIKKLMEVEEHRIAAQEALCYCISNKSQNIKVQKHGCVTCCRCNLEDAEQYYSRIENELGTVVVSERTKALENPLGICFITVGSEDQAKYIADKFMPGSIRSWNITKAPSPLDINWENLEVSMRHWYSKAIIINVILFVFFFFLTTPAIVVNTLNTYTAAQKDIISSISPVFSEFFPTLLLLTMSALMPVIVAYSDQWMSHWTKSKQNLATMNKTFFFLLFMVLILPSLGLTSAQAFVEWSLQPKNKTMRWECIFLADKGAFFVNYVITSALIGTALELLRFPELAMYVWRLLWMKSKAEKVTIRKQILSIFPFGIHYSWTLLVYTIATVYSVICLTYVNMKIVATQWLLFVSFGVSTAIATKPQSTTPRTVTPTGQVITRLTSRVPNVSHPEIITDIRTPPKVKQMIKKIEVKTEHVIENSHPGLAEPIDDDIEALEDSMKKINFYKIERPTTTDSGLSTWILLSGQSKISSTRKPSLAPSKVEDRKNSSVIPFSSGGTKLLFKKRPSNTSTKNTSTTPKSTVTSKPFLSTVSYTESTTKPTQNKTSGSTSAVNHKNSTTLINLKTKNTVNDVKKNDTKTTAVNNKIANNVLTSTTELGPELKHGDIELPSSTANPKKSRRPTNKKKKDKNRRKRPSVESKDDVQNKTKISNKISQKEKPITTQIYNYLAREVMPTVGVGLVGLVVTAGLASYFLYPFGSLRRSYEIERKDKDFYYYDTNKMTSDYDGGIAEEEAIGKVIAGMPFSSNNIYGNNYNQKSNSNNRYRQSDSTFYQKLKGSVESLQLQPIKEYNKNDNYMYNTQYSSNINKNILPPYNKNIISQNVEASYTTNDQQFVVGNVPTDVEEITPAVVPEHGPRNLKIRKRRTVDNDVIKNEIDVDEIPQKFDEFEKEQSTLKKNNTVAANATKTTVSIPTKYTFIDFFQDLVTAKLRVGLELLQNQTLAFSRYLSSVQRRLYDLRSSNVTK